MSQPDLDLLHGDAIAEKQAGAGMTEVVKANFSQFVFLNEPCEMFRYIVGAQELAALVNADIVEIVLTVGLFEQPPVHLLFFLFLQQESLCRRDQRKRPEAGFGFQNILAYRYKFAVHLRLDDLMTDGDPFVFQIDGAPSESKNLASPQAIVCSDFHAQFQRIAGYGIEQGLDEHRTASYWKWLHPVQRMGEALSDQQQEQPAHSHKGR